MMTKLKSVAPEVRVGSEVVMVLMESQEPMERQAPEDCQEFLGQWAALVVMDKTESMA